MTSGAFTSVPVNSIIINREDRQRRELKGIEELAKSIADNGLINPIVITRENVLVAGERRLTAHKYLGFDEIVIQYLDEVDELAMHAIELEENIRRDDLDWQDRVQAVARYHELQASTKKDWSQDDTAKALNISSTHVSRYMLVDDMLKDGVEEVVNSDRLSSAMSFAARAHERRKSSALRELRSAPPINDLREGEKESTPLGLPQAPPEPTRYAEILNEDFLLFSKLVPETPFNFIHCDFPYGVRTGDTTGYSAKKTLGGYDDGADIYFALLDALCQNGDRFIDGSAHLMFWFSMDYYTETRERLSTAGWRVNPFPLIWHKSDNTGVMPDPQRGPRRTYETAFLATRGDRKVVKPIANSTAHPGKRGDGKQFHMSEKSLPMLEHFFRMFVDQSTVMLDPTCGSGNAVKAAESAGAAYSLGLELSAEYVERAKENLNL